MERVKKIGLYVFFIVLLAGIYLGFDPLLRLLISRGFITTGMTLGFMELMSPVIEYFLKNSIDPLQAIWLIFVAFGIIVSTLLGFLIFREVRFLVEDTGKEFFRK